MEIGDKITQKIFDRQIINIGIVVLLGTLYAPLLLHWSDGWLNKTIGIEHEYFSHALIGFPYAIYICWLQRKKWQQLPDRVHPSGPFLLTLGTVFYLTGVAEWVNLSFPLILIGVCASLKGMPGLKLQSFPLLLVLLATPNSLPYLITPFTLPLQQFIATVAGFILMQFNFNINVEGIYLFANGRITEVAPYCAGLKMLFTTFYVALMLLHWTGNLKDRRKTISLLLIVPIVSITGNIIRNTILTYFHSTNQEQMFVWLHDGWGGDIYSALTLFILIPIINLIDNFFSELAPNNEE